MMMIEKIARSMCQKDIEIGTDEKFGQRLREAWAEGEWQNWLPYAFAALYALREANETMLDESAAGKWGICPRDERRDLHRSHIDAAIAEGMTLGIGL